MSEIPERLAEAISSMVEEALYYGVRGKPRPTALRMRNGRMETVDLDEAGNVIEPPAKCCYGVGIHAPNCKFWRTCT